MQPDLGIEKLLRRLGGKCIQSVLKLQTKKTIFKYRVSLKVILPVKREKMANLDRINELIGEKDFEKAQELIEPALKEEPDNIELLKLAGLQQLTRVTMIKHG